MECWWPGRRPPVEVVGAVSRQLGCPLVLRHRGTVGLPPTDSRHRASLMRNEELRLSTLKVNQIRTKLRQMFEPHLDLSDIGAHDSERDQKILSRCLAALAVYLQTGCSEKEAAESVWDGGDDNGVDAAYFDPSDLRVVLVQSKWINKGSGEPEAKDIGAFTKGVRDIVEQDSTGFRPGLHAKFSDIALRISSPGTSVHLVLVSTGASQLGPVNTNAVHRRSARS
jgi:hypothetical protein